jgi:aminopeptidase Y
MMRLLPALIVSSVARASIIQQQPLADSHLEAIIASTKKPLVDSESLQSHISSDKLLRRAKHLYKIAELGEDEYNHPTRVIGSEGRSFPQSPRVRGYS